MRKIIHIDMDCFFAAIEMRDNPKYRDIPLAVGGSPEQRGVLSTCNYKAREFGLHSAMSSSYALKLCPDLIIIEPHFDKYYEVSEIISEIFFQFTDLVEPISLDEAFLDVTNTRKYQRSGTWMAQEIRRKIFDNTGLTASAGVAPNKLLAKIASDWNKPNGQFVIVPNQVLNFMKDLPVGKIFGVGKVTERKLKEYGFNNCGDLQKKSKLELYTLLGNFGDDLYSLCRGIDDRPVVSNYVRKSLSVESTFSEDLQTIEQCLARIPEIHSEFLSRLEKLDDSFEIKNIMFKIKFSDFKITTIEKGITDLSLDNFITLCREAYTRRDGGVRLLGLGVKFISAKEEDPHQLKLL